MFIFNESRSICLAKAITTRSYESSFGGNRSSKLGGLEELWYDNSKQAFVIRGKDEILWGVWRSKAHACSKAQARSMLFQLSMMETEEQRSFVHLGMLCRVDRHQVRQGQRLELQFYTCFRRQELSLDPSLACSLLQATKRRVWEKIE